MQSFYIAKGDTSEGPFTEHELKARLKNGEITDQEYAWTEGMSEWLPLCEVLKGLEAEPLEDFVPESLKPNSKGRNQSSWEKESIGCKYRINETDGVLEIHEDHLTIQPQGVSALLAKGLKGKKHIPFNSITSIQVKNAGFVARGYIQFTIPGGIESRGGLFEALLDENTFAFGEDNNNRVAVIKNYIEARIKELRNPPPSQVTASTSLADELAKLAALKNQGLLSDEEFQAAKRRLIG